MTDNVTFQKAVTATPPNATIVETKDQGGGVQRQVVEAATYIATPLGYEQLTGLSSAKGLQTIPAGATFALIAVNGATIRWRDDGIDPTISLGIPEYPTQQFQYAGSLDAIKFIETSASAILDIAYYK